MHIQVIAHPGKNIALVESDGPFIYTAQDALDLMATAQYEHDATRIILPKGALCEEFFDLKTGVAGEILQKYTNYRIKLAIVGDFSGYESEALKDFIYESNQGNQLFFLADNDMAIETLQKV